MLNGSLLICFFETYNIYLMLLFHFFLLERLLNDNKYFKGIKHSLENWMVDRKSVFVYKSISLLIYFIYLFYLFKLRS